MKQEQRRRPKKQRVEWVEPRPPAQREDVLGFDVSSTSDSESESEDEIREDSSVAAPAALVAKPEAAKDDESKVVADSSLVAGETNPTTNSNLDEPAKKALSDSRHEDLELNVAKPADSCKENSQLTLLNFIGTVWYPNLR